MKKNLILLAAAIVAAAVACKKPDPQPGPWPDKDPKDTTQIQPGPGPEPEPVTLKHLFAGEGTTAEPFQIATAADLKSLSDVMAIADSAAVYASASYLQTADIDMASVEGFFPIGRLETQPFKGTYDGDGKKISNLVWTPFAPTGYVNAGGLFGYIESATVKNVAMVDAKLTSEAATLDLGGKDVGTVVGSAKESLISGCSASGYIRSTGIPTTEVATCCVNAGGIVGYAVKSEITGCSFSGTVNTLGHLVGGIAGMTDGTKVHDCVLEEQGVVLCARNYDGGIVGYAINGSEVYNCTTKGSVTSSGYNIGGTVGRLDQSSVHDCLVESSTELRGIYHVGGIVGHIYVPADAAYEGQVYRNAAYAKRLEAGYSIGGVVAWLDARSTTKPVSIVSNVCIGSELYSTGVNSAMYSLVAGICPWVGYSGKSVAGAKVYIVGNAATPKLAGGVKVNGMKGVVGGMIGYQITVNLNMIGNYSNLQDVDFAFSDTPVNKIGGDCTYFGGMYGKCATSNIKYDRNYYSNTIVPGPGYSKLTAVVSNIEALSDAQMTDGTLLTKLSDAADTWNATSPSVRAEKWVAGPAGYPVIEGLPAYKAPVESKKKRVSIIGDSISTFRGIVPGTYSCHYPTADGDVTDWHQTYWGRLITDYLKNATLGKNIAFSGTAVANTTVDRAAARGYASDVSWLGKSYCVRLMEQGLDNPDIVLIHGGTNDFYHNCDYLLGTVNMREDYTPAAADMNAIYSVTDAADTYEKACALDDNTFAGAYAKMLQLIKLRYPSAKVVCVIGDCLSPGIERVTIALAEHFGYRSVDTFAVNGYGDIRTERTYYTTYKKDWNWYPMPKHDGGCHPGSEAFAFMAKMIYEQCGEYMEN